MRVKLKKSYLALPFFCLLKIPTLNFFDFFKRTENPHIITNLSVFGFKAHCWELVILFLVFNNTV